MKKAIFLLIIFCTSISTLTAQHCGWCFQCCNILILEKKAVNPEHDYLVCLLDSAMKPVIDFNNDTVFFAQQKSPYKLESHPLYEVNSLPEMDTLMFTNFQNPNYFVTLFQYCFPDSFPQHYVYIENLTTKQKQIVELSQKNFQRICISRIGLNRKNKTMEIYKDFERYERGIVRAE